MKDIIYITTAQEDNEFEEFKKGWKFTLNPSSVNLHNKMISSLSLTNNIYVFSIRPYDKSCDNIDLNSKSHNIGNVTYYYLKINKNKYMRPFSYLTEISKIIKGLNLKNSPLIISETINYSCIYIAKKLRDKFKYPLIGILTDSPNYISFVSTSYKKKLLKASSDLNGYIALNNNLNNLFNVNKKPNIIIKGIVDERIIKKDKNVNNGKPYFYYGGNCLKIFGIYNLIEAYKKLNLENVSLLISGHHENIDELKSTFENYDIKYLGNLSLLETIKYEENSLASINPRPYNKEIDLYSVPSKNLEYLASKTIVISTKSTILQEDFLNDIIWCEDDSIDSISSCLKKVIEMNEEEKEQLKEKSYKKVKELYSKNKVNQKLSLFINNLF